MIILDTNVLSAMMQTEPDQLVEKWLDKQPRDSIWTTSVNLMEVRFGLNIMPLGKKRSTMIDVFTIFLEEKIKGRIVPFDTSAADHAAELMAVRRQKGRPVDFRDTMIAGIALANRATLATRNVSHFADLSTPIVNPWTD